MKKIIILAFILFQFSSVNAQMGIRNSGVMRIHPGTTMSGWNNFTNASTATYINNGTIYLKANITNNETGMAAGSGTTVLDGSSTQTIAGSAAFNVNDLTTNNATGFVVNTNLSIAGTHTFSNGVLVTSVTPNYVIYEAGSSQTGSADTRHVNGWVKKNGSTNFTFPVGNGTYLRDVAISGLSGASEFNCHYYPATSNIYNLFSPLVQVKANEYWQLNQISGGTAQVTLNWNHAKVPMDNILIIDILAGRYNGSVWVDHGGTASGNVATTGNVTSNLIGTFGSFTFGYKSYPVPLKLISFTGERRQGTSYLKWVTENEVMVDRFEVERSYDAQHYTSIGNVAARNLSSRQNYYFEDRTALQGIAYYRLRSIDIDGKTTYSNIVALSDNVNSTAAFTVLNPAKGGITIFNRSSKEGLFEYSVLNTSWSIGSYRKCIFEFKWWSSNSVTISNKYRNSFS